MEVNTLLPHPSWLLAPESLAVGCTFTNCLHQRLQPFTPWSAEDLGAGCCPMLFHCYMETHSHSIPLVLPRWPGNEYTWKEMRTEKQQQCEKPEQHVPAPTAASSDQPDQSTAGEGQCKGSGFLHPNQQA